MYRFPVHSPNLALGPSETSLAHADIVVRKNRLVEAAGIPLRRALASGRPESPVEEFCIVSHGV